MKFLITGSLRASNGPRLLVTSAILFFFCFTVAHLLREAGSTGLTPATIRQNLYAGPTDALIASDAPPGFLAVLEDLHIDLFFFGLLGLLLGSVLYQVRVAETLKRGLIYALFLFPLLFILSRGCVYFFADAAYLVPPTGFLTYATLVGTQLLILRDLYR